ncbi:iron ABC transporter substrate-binding protein [Archaeoglobus sp.]|uniref:iron ABC transporter substrate-binding protein n=1 Tax=Archaeoglobus sp. TaxID=1872626 RepID=UPI0024AA8935|nr:iron ABC transporter substrate-binding protein [Archaeoglobus sp.]MDI3497245.1 iron complex transport system substrate-binding protein [Archaeoglobus sp.]
MRKVLLLALALAILIAGCAQQPAQVNQEGKVTVTDMLGRTVEVPEKVERVVAIGPGALRLVVYLNASDKVVGVEDAETNWPEMGRPYRMAHPEFANLPTIGKGGPNPSPNAEAIVAVKPDVIFACYIDATQADTLQQQTGVPVVVLSYGELGNFRAEEIYTSLRLAGKILGREERAKEIISFIENAYKDLTGRVEGVPEENKLSVYVGALGFKGGHGIESTQCNFPPFMVVRAKNVACEANVSGAFFIDKEKLLEWDPDIIFLDENNLHLVLNDYEKNPEIYQSLKAFKNGKIYGILPFNYYTTNIETAIADSYFIGKVLYPDKFADIDPAKKADEIFEFFVGKKLYEQMAEHYGGFKNIADVFEK